MDMNVEAATISRKPPRMRPNSVSLKKRLDPLWPLTGDSVPGSTTAAKMRHSKVSVAEYDFMRLNNIS